MIEDFIHMTQGELLLHYWWLWSIIVIIAIVYMLFDDGLL